MINKDLRLNMSKKTFRKHEEEILEKIKKDVIEDLGRLDMTEVNRRYNATFKKHN